MFASQRPFEKTALQHTEADPHGGNEGILPPHDTRKIHPIASRRLAPLYNYSTSAPKQKCASQGRFARGTRAVPFMPRSKPYRPFSGTRRPCRPKKNSPAQQHHGCKRSGRYPVERGMAGGEPA
jgi:hypothetical protein